MKENDNDDNDMKDNDATDRCCATAINGIDALATYSKDATNEKVSRESNKYEEYT